VARDLTNFFSPKSVAVIGASRTPEKVGAIVLKNIIDSKFPGKIYPVNPNVININNIPCFPDILSLPEVPDLALLALPVTLVLDTLNQLGQKGVKNVVVYAAGFKEIGAEGEELEKQLIEVSQKYQMNVLGPNCLGFINNNCPINATFGKSLNQSGNLRFISQSGAIATSLFDWCESSSLGFSDFVTLGNKAVISENDVLEYFQNNSNQQINMGGLSSVAPIGLYLESITNGSEFLKITSQISKINPIFALKPGKTKAASLAMQSHTGAIAGEDNVLVAALEQAGVIRCQSLEDFFDFARGFALENAPIGPRVAVISNAGGPAVLSADAIVESGLELAQLDDSIKSLLQKVLPRAASVLNPVDVLGDALADRFIRATEIILQTNQVDAVIVILTPQIMTQIEQTAQGLGNLSKKYQKPILCSFIGGKLVSVGEQVLNQSKIPVFRFPERAIETLGVMWKFKKGQQQDEITTDQPLVVKTDIEKIKEIITNAQKKNQKTLDNLEANEVVSSIGIPTPETSLVTSLEHAKEFIGMYGLPVVLKLSSPGLLHKKAVGGVINDIRDEEQLEIAWDNLQRSITHLEKETQQAVKVQIQKDILNGVEVIVGIKRDPTFGAVLLFGAGGSLAQMINDRNLHLLPISSSQITKLVEKSKVFDLLNGSETEPPLALNKLYDLVKRLGQIMEFSPEISDIEINPVIVTLNNVWAVDAKIILSDGEKKIAAPAFKLTKVIQNQNLATTFHYVEFESEQPLDFLPGQYINVKVDTNRINCYSVATKSGTNKFGLLVDTCPGGPGSKFFQHLKMGDKMTYLGPFGSFNLKENDGSQGLLLLGTGSGLAPLRMMLDSALIEKKMTLPIYLYLGLKSPKDVFWLDYFQNLSKQYPNFKYKVSVDKGDEAWQGSTGFITDLVKQDFTDASKLSAYLCGNKYMIEDMTNILTEKGMPKEKVYKEKL